MCSDARQSATRCRTKTSRIGTMREPVPKERNDAPLDSGWPTDVVIGDLISDRRERDREQNRHRCTRSAQLVCDVADVGPVFGSRRLDAGGGAATPRRRSAIRMRVLASTSSPERRRTRTRTSLGNPDLDPSDTRSPVRQSPAQPSYVARHGRSRAPSRPAAEAVKSPLGSVTPTEASATGPFRRWGGPGGTVGRGGPQFPQSFRGFR